MHRPNGTRRLLALLGVCAALLSSSACGGSADDPFATVAVFTPSQPAPSGSISLQPESSSGLAFSIRVAVKDVPNLFGAAFHVTFNAGVIQFVSADFSQSFLTGTGITTQLTATAVRTHPGDVAVVATRVQNVGGTVPTVSVTDGDLVVLNFRAVAATSGTTILFGTPREADTCNVTTHVCSAILIPPQNWIGGILTAY